MLTKKTITVIFSASVESAARSRMNVVFRLPNEDLENKFVAEADEQGYMHVKGHRLNFFSFKPFILRVYSTNLVSYQFFIFSYRVCA